VGGATNTSDRDSTQKGGSSPSTVGLSNGGQPGNLAMGPTNEEASGQENKPLPPEEKVWLSGPAFERRCARGRSVRETEIVAYIKQPVIVCETFPTWHPKPVSGWRRGLCRRSWSWTSGRGFESHRGGWSRCDRTRRDRYPSPALPNRPTGSSSFGCVRGPSL